MKHWIFVLALVIFSLGMASPSYAQRGNRGGGGGGGYGALGVPSAGTDTAGAKYQDYVYGIIRTLNKDSVVLTKTQSGADQTFKFNKKTKFIRDGKDSSLETLKLGEEVWIDPNEDKKTGDIYARKVLAGAFLMPSY